MPLPVVLQVPPTPRAPRCPRPLSGPLLLTWREEPSYLDKARSPQMGYARHARGLRDAARRQEHCPAVPHSPRRADCAHACCLPVLYDPPCCFSCLAVAPLRCGGVAVGVMPCVACACVQVLGSAKAPLHMVTADGGWKRQAWATLRTLGTAFLVLSALGAMVEDNKIGKSEARHHPQRCWASP